MKMQLVAIKDTAVQAYMQPAFVQHTGAAVRTFTTEINNPSPQGELFKHPSDLELYHLGEFDDSTGRFDCPPDPVLLLRGKDAKTNS